MKVNTALRKMRDGKPAFGWSLGLGSPVAAEIMSASGVDFIFVDTQHGSWGQDSTNLAFMAIHAGGSVPMARVATNNYTQIGRLLDEGAMGIIVPLVHTAADAKAAADACRIPPTGTRSWGWGGASRYGDDYSEHINDELFVAVQFESVQSIENAEAIMATPGVDGCWIGPADLALSIGIHPKDMLNDERHQKALESVIQACRNTGKIPGFAAFSPADAKVRAEQGFQFLTAGSDIGFMLAGAKAGLKTLGLE